ncbi:Branched-chain amino acid permease [Bacillus cereus]|uniref:Branched-chain amino acid permease n=1 Tax=Bacillus cereus TaxID=1396 RepID=UPI003AF0F9E0
MVQVKRPFLRPLIVFGVSAVSFVLLIITGMAYALDYYAKNEQTASQPKSDTIYQETDKLKGDISLLETQNKTLDAEVKRLKEELAKKEQSTQPVQHELPKKEDVKPESQQPAAQPEKKEEPKQEQPTGTFANPVKSIDKTETMNKVKEKAKKDFQDDYSTQNYVANKQSKAFDYLNNIEIKSQEELNIINKALRDFPTDFSTAKYVYERQMKAKGEQEAQ